jgi:hypothetical protein
VIATPVSISFPFLGSAKAIAPPTPEAIPLRPLLAELKSKLFNLSLAF